MHTLNANAEFTFLPVLIRSLRVCIVIEILSPKSDVKAPFAQRVINQILDVYNNKKNLQLGAFLQY
jgi:hypothetical protein